MAGARRVETGAEQGAASYEDLLAGGKARAEADDVAGARAAFAAALTLDAGRPEARLWLCRLAYKTADWKGLHGRAGDYVADWPNDGEARLLFARGCNGVADWPAAARAWATVCEDRPGWPEARFQHGRALLRLDEWARAAEIADALATAPDGGVYVVRLRVELNDFAGAKAALEALFRSDPAIAAKELEALDRAKNRRGLAAGFRARLDAEGDGAIDADQLLEVSETLFRRAIRNERAGDLMEAFFDYDALLALAPDDDLVRRSRARIARALADLARQHLEAEAFPEAAEAFARAARAAPGDIAPLRGQGRALMRLREWAKAAALWGAFARAFPDDPEGAVQLARALDRSGRYGEAMDAWRAVQAREPDHEEARESLSTILRRTIVAGRLAIAEDRFLDAYALFQTARREDPKDEEPARRLEQVGRNLRKAMRTAYKAGDLRQVLQCGPAATDLLPGDPEVQLLIGRAAAGLRRHEVALAAWSRFGELDPGQAALADLQIARCHLHLGNAEKGTAAARRVLVADPKNVEARQLIDRLRTLD